MFYLFSNSFRILSFVLFLILTFSFSEISWAQAGSLDTSFGIDGKVITTLGTYSDKANALAIQGDDKILMAGSKFSSFTKSDFALVRYMDDGSLDSSFGVGGEVITTIENRSEAHAIAIQNNGKIIAGGASKWFINLARYNTNGSLDTTFGDNGIVITDVPDYYGAVCRSVAIQDDGKIIIGGYASDSGDDQRHFIVLRYLSNGSLDTTFGANGMVIGSQGECHSVKIQNTGEIVLGGTNSGYFFIEKYHSSGTLDLSFGLNGKVVTFVETTAQGRSMVIQDDGKILLGGFSHTSQYNYALVRYNTNGLLDSFFGFYGVSITSIGDKGMAYSLAVQSDGKILLSGNSYTDSNIFHLTVARYQTDGTLDTDFGQGGKVITPIGDSYSTGQTIGIDNYGKIMVGGYTYIDSNVDMALVRYHSVDNIGIDENNTIKENHSIIPNPFSQSTSIQLNSPVNHAELMIYNIHGQLVNYRHNISGSEIPLFRQDLPSGLYYLKIIEGQRTIVEDKLIITD